MNSAKFKAYIITIILFGGIAYMLFGSELPKLSELNFFHKFSLRKEDGSSATRKKTNTYNKTANAKTGQVLDTYKGVNVFYNGSVGNVFGRNVTDDGYNLGLKYQCVEFAKRFYYEAYNHKMADSYGHAKDFFNTSLSSGSYNKARGMYQFNNKTFEKPKVDDLCIIGPSSGNSFGHLFIITQVTSNSVEFVQQNGGSRNPSRGEYKLVNEDGLWNLRAPNLLGWLRMH